MQSGKNRHRIVIEQPVKVKTDSGAINTTWSTFKETWAEVRTLKMYEKSAIETSFPKADMFIGFRYIEGVLSTMRITYKGKIYSILGINNVDERNRELELICETGTKVS